MTKFEELDLVESLSNEGLSDEMIESVVYAENNPDKWEGPFDGVEELNEWLESEDA